MFFLQLGNTPKLSLAELRAVYPLIHITQTHEQWVQISGDFEPLAALKRLGGCVKATQVIKEIASTDPEEVTAVLVDYLEDTARAHSGTLSWGVAEIGRDHLPKINPAQIKDILKERNVKTRYVESSRLGLSAAVLQHQAVVEVVLISQTQKTSLTVTCAVQDVDTWSMKDRGRPMADRKRGMLPPKVARMMLNIALGTQDPTKAVVADPFCGMGTILAEALHMHVPILLGSDIDHEAITGTRANLHWMSKHFELYPKVELQECSATHISWPDHPTILVTEPFLGKQTPRPQELANQFKGLEKLYWGALKRWSTQLTQPTTIVLITPEVILPVRTNDIRQFSLDRLIDKSSELGYTTASEMVEYHRPDATVRRHIHHLVFNPNSKE